MEINEGKKDVFKQAGATKKKTRDLENIRCIKGQDNKVLVEETKMRKRLWSYFSMLFNGERSEYSLRVERGGS